MESDLLEQATFVGSNGADCSNVGRKIKERRAVTTTNRSLGGRNPLLLKVQLYFVNNVNFVQRYKKMAKDNLVVGSWVRIVKPATTTTHLSFCPPPPLVQGRVAASKPKRLDFA